MREYRVRKNWLGQCVLQVLVNGPSFIGGQVDSSRRDPKWYDVDFQRSPAILVEKDEKS